MHWQAGKESRVASALVCISSLGLEIRCHVRHYALSFPRASRLSEWLEPRLRLSSFVLETLTGLTAWAL